MTPHTSPADVSRSTPAPAGPLPSSSLDPSCTQEGIETSLQGASISGESTSWQESQFKNLNSERVRIALQLDAEARQIEKWGLRDEARKLRTAAQRLDACSRTALVRFSPSTSKLRIFKARCRSRLCPLCIKLRSYQVMADLLKIVSTFDAPKLLTLTLKACSDPLRDQLDRLTRSFAALRRRPLWKDHCHAGAFTIELTFNPRTGLWHPHLHAVLDSDFLKQADLADAWQEITGDSRIVDIRAAHSRAQVAKYICKYVTKSGDASAFRRHALGEWASALHGKRLFTTFGKAHAIKAEDKAPEKLPRDEESICPLPPLVHAAQAGDPVAAKLNEDLAAAVSRGVHDAPPTSPPLPPIDHRDLAQRLRAWWQGHIGATHANDPPRDDDRRTRHHPGDRTKWLWKEPDFGPS